MSIRARETAEVAGKALAGDEDELRRAGQDRHAPRTRAPHTPRACLGHASRTRAVLKKVIYPSGATARSAASRARGASAPRGGVARIERRRVFAALQATQPDHCSEHRQEDVTHVNRLSDRAISGKRASRLKDGGVGDESGCAGRAHRRHGAWRARAAMSENQRFRDR